MKEPASESGDGVKPCELNHWRAVSAVHHVAQRTVIDDGLDLHIGSEVLTENQRDVQTYIIPRECEVHFGSERVLRDSREDTGQVDSFDGAKGELDASVLPRMLVDVAGVTEDSDGTVRVNGHDGRGPWELKTNVQLLVHCKLLISAVQDY